jgi:hypothetical protein
MVADSDYVARAGTLNMLEIFRGGHLYREKLVAVTVI